MSLLRTGHGPLDWRDEGPSVASSRHPAYATRNAEPVGHMLPNVVYPLRGMHAHIEPIREAKVRPTCGVMMPLVGEPCARMPGHLDSHRSRVVMDTDKAMRASARDVMHVLPRPRGAYRRWNGPL